MSETLQIIPRADWQANYGQGHATSGAKVLLVVHHDGKNLISADATPAGEAALMRRIERYHAVDNGWAGIGYNFAIMPSGRVYEARGWGRVGSHVPGNNSSSIGVFLPVNGDLYEPSAAVVAAFQRLRAQGVRLGHLSPKHVTRGHQDFNKPECPGDRVYQCLVRDLADVAVPTFRDVVRAHPTLRQGKGGRQATEVERNLVKLLQAKLRNLGYLRPVDVTGFFGPVTDRAVQEFQRRRRLTVDGIVGGQTWAALGA